MSSETKNTKMPYANGTFLCDELQTSGDYSSLTDLMNHNEKILQDSLLARQTEDEALDQLEKDTMREMERDTELRVNTVEDEQSQLHEQVQDMEGRLTVLYGLMADSEQRLEEVQQSAVARKELERKTIQDKREEIRDKRHQQDKTHRSRLMQNLV